MAQCEDCDEALPVDREDTLCVDCRRGRIIYKRANREAIEPVSVPVPFSEKKVS